MQAAARSLGAVIPPDANARNPSDMPDDDRFRRPPGRCIRSSQRDTIDLGDLPLSRVLVINDANYPWLLLVPRRPGVVEIIDLDEVEQAQLMTEIARVGRALKDGDRNATSSTSPRSATSCRNCTCMSIARRQSDAAWPKPVWGARRRSTMISPRSTVSCMR